MGRRTANTDVLNARTIYINPRDVGAHYQTINGSKSITATLTIVGLTGAGVMEVCDLIFPNGENLHMRCIVDDEIAFSTSSTLNYGALVGYVGGGSAFTQGAVPFRNNFSVRIRKSAALTSTCGARVAYRLVQL